MEKISVIIVEDSKLMQEILKKILSSDPAISVVGVADDPLLARDLIKKMNPAVITLDIMLPHMDGITFLKNLMRLHPMPVVMVSNLTKKGSAIGLEALALGAVDYLPKPTNNESDLAIFEKKLIETIKTAAKAKVKKMLVPPITVTHSLQNIINDSHLLREKIIAIGASTGGIEAIETILLQLPQVLPPIVIVQHIIKEFSSNFSKRISSVYGFSALEPKDQEELLPGHIYIAPAGKHLVVAKQKNHYIAEYTTSSSGNNHCPSINILFDSIAKAAGENAIGILLTGMGKDGAAGLKEIHNLGGITIAQDEATSMVWGMPKAAIDLKAVDYILPIHFIHQKILEIIDIMILNQKNMVS